MFVSMKFASLLAAVAASVHAAPAPQFPSSIAAPSSVAFSSSFAVPSASSVAIPSASVSSLAIPSASVSSFAIPSASVSSFSVPPASVSSFAIPSGSVSSFSVPSAAVSSVAISSASFVSIPSASTLASAPVPASTDVPSEPGEDLVISPPVTSPNLLSVWTVGSNQTVTWDTSNIPDEYKNETGLLLLGYSENGSEHLDINDPLATQFPIGQGSVALTVPNVTTRHDYIVVLFGDSGNASPLFTITGGQ